MRKNTLTGIKAFFEAYAVDNQTTEYAEWISELTDEIARVEAKANYISPAEKAKKERAAYLYDAIVEVMTTATAPLTVADIKLKGEFNDTPQKLTSVVNRLVADGKLIRTYDKRTATYTLA